MRSPGGRPARLVRILTGLVAVAALAFATVSWIALSRPFDPSQLRAYTVAAPASLPDVPEYPGAITILTYHAVSDTDHAASTVSRQRFAEHLATLAALGYRTVRLEDVAKVVAHEPVRLPDRPLLLTLDGGALTDWTVVDPVLAAYHFNAVALLSTSKIVAAGTPSYFLSTRQVDRMRRSGRWEFGSRGDDLARMVPIPGDIGSALTNRVLVGDRTESDDEWAQRIEADLMASQRALTKLTGAAATVFAYPFGEAGADSNVDRIGERLPEMLSAAGFGYAFVGENVPTGHVDAVSSSSPRWLLPRIGIRATTSVDDLVQMIRAATPTAPVPDLTRAPWVGDLATCSVDGPALRLAMSARGYGSCELHDVNTSQWLDYTVTTRISGVDRQSTAVIAVRDGTGAGHHGRVEIVVGESKLILREQIGDDARTVLGTKTLSGHGPHTVAVSVAGSQVTVSVDGRAALSAATDPRLHEGGVMFSEVAEGPHALVFHAPALTVRPG
jgi:biofilm PGA synthesis lipoprotein PgaB